MRSCRSADGRVRGAIGTLLLLVAIALGDAAPGRAAAGRIVVAPESVVAGETVHLGDVARLEGEGVQALGGVELSVAPGAGESRVLDGQLVLQTIARAAGGLDGITYRIPAEVRVRRATQEVSPAAVRQLVERFVAETLGERAGDAVVRTVDGPGRIQIPAGAYEAHVRLPNGAALLGRTRLQIEFAVAGAPARSVWVVADIGLIGPVVVTTRSVERGEVLTAADLALDRRDLSQAPRGVATDFAEAVGFVTRSALGANAPVRLDQLHTPAAVRRGDAVQLVAERGALRITVPGEVRDDGAVGAQVRVVNRATRKELYGRVLDGGTVEVAF